MSNVDWFTSPSAVYMSPRQVLEKAIAEFHPVRVFACFSGGNDSQVSTHFSMKNGYAQEVFNLNTGIGIPESREHMYRVADRFNWPLRVKTPPELSYEQMVLKFGFPGPGCHKYPYVWLKERAICELVQETKQNYRDKVMLITGVRQMESRRRMGYVEPIYEEGARLWVAPFYSFSAQQRDAYMSEHNLVRNPVTEKLGVSGECMCGAYRSDGEREKIRKHYPDFDSYLCWLEDAARSAGQVYPEWGTGIMDDPDQFDIEFMPMCVSCINRQKDS